MANNQKLTDQDFKNVYTYVRSWFDVDISETEMLTIKKNISY